MLRKNGRKMSLFCEAKLMQLIQSNSNLLHNKIKCLQLLPVLTDSLPAQGRPPGKMTQARGCSGPTPTMTRLPIPTPHPLSYSHTHVHTWWVVKETHQVPVCVVWGVGQHVQEVELETQQWALASVECTTNQKSQDIYLCTSTCMLQ